MYINFKRVKEKTFLERVAKKIYKYRNKWNIYKR